MSKKVIGGYVFQQIINKGRMSVMEGLTAVNQVASENVGPQTRAAYFVKIGIAFNELTMMLNELEQYAKEYKTGELRLEDLNLDDDKKDG